ncbi:MAG: baseplate J/gp47 family protein [Pseudomonadota bacterium]
MASSFATPTLDEIHETLVADYQNQFPEDDCSRYSDAWKRLRVYAGGLLGLHAHVETAYEDLMPDGAASAFLERHGDLYDVMKNAATAAHKDAALRVYGSVGATVSDNAELTHTDGTQFKIPTGNVIPAGGYYDFGIEAITLGVAGKKDAGEILTFTSPPVGIQADAELQLDIDEGGAAAEEDGPYRERILDAIAEPGMGGASSDYRHWTLEISGVASAHVYPGRAGLGSIHLACLGPGEGTDRILTTETETEIETYINTVRPVSVYDFAVIPCVGAMTNVEVTVIPQDDSAFAFDWTEPGTPLTVASWTAGTRTLELSASRPADMAVGDRIVVKRTSSPRNDGHEYVIEAFGAAADEIVLAADDDFTASPPNAGASVYSGGPLVAPVRTAILAHFNSLGPCRDAYADGPTSWVSTLYLSTLFRLAQNTDGVLDSTIVAPTANVVPSSSPPVEEVQVLLAYQILVRKG